MKTRIYAAPAVKGLKRLNNHASNNAVIYPFWHPRIHAGLQKEHPCIHASMHPGRCVYWETEDKQTGKRLLSGGIISRGWCLIGTGRRAVSSPPSAPQSSPLTANRIHPHSTPSKIPFSGAIYNIANWHYQPRLSVKSRAALKWFFQLFLYFFRLGTWTIIYTALLPGVQVVSFSGSTPSPPPPGLRRSGSI